MNLTRVIALSVCMAVFAGDASAQSLFEKVTKGAGKVGEAIGTGGGKVGGAVEKGVGMVGDSIDSTVDLATNEATPEETRAELDRMAEETMNRFFAETPEATNLYLASAGHAVFDTRKISVLPVSGGFGRGVAISKAGGARTYMNMGTGGVGVSLGFGGFESQVVILFETPADFDAFVINGYEASAETGAVMGNDKADQSIRFVEGRSTFVLSKKGWRVNVNAAGVKYWRSPELN